MRLSSRTLVTLAMPLLFTACATVAPPQPPSLNLPKPPLDLRATRKANRVTLTWTVPSVTTDRQRVLSFGPTRICRGSAAMTKCDVPVGEVNVSSPAPGKSAGKRSATYTDTLPTEMLTEDPSVFVAYAVEVRNAAIRSAGLSNQVRVSLLPTMPPFLNFAAETSAQGVKISWTVPPPIGREPSVECLFRIYRRPEGNTASEKIVDLDLPHCLGVAGLAQLGSQSQPASPTEGTPASYLDQTFQWERTYYYHGTIVTVSKAPGKPIIEIEGSDTPEVKVFANDVFPPAVPSGLQAVFSGPGQAPFVDLIWAPVPDVDLNGYNVYRHEAGSEPLKINKELVKAPAYRDTEVTSGKHYFYSVTAVDMRGNESKRSEDAEESVP